MRSKPSATKNSSSGVIPNVPWRVQEVRPLEEFRLYVKFVDNSEGIVDLSQLIKSDKAGVFMVLRDPELFNDVYLNYGAVSWPGELDLAPDAMYDEIKKKGEWILE